MAMNIISTVFLIFSQERVQNTQGAVPVVGIRIGPGQEEAEIVIARGGGQMLSAGGDHRGEFSGAQLVFGLDQKSVPVDGSLAEGARGKGEKDETEGDRGADILHGLSSSPVESIKGSIGDVNLISRFR